MGVCYASPQSFSYSLFNNFGDLNLILIGWFIRLSVHLRPTYVFGEPIVPLFVFFKVFKFFKASSASLSVFIRVSLQWMRCILFYTT